jgi:hypothetical protein
MLMIRNTERVLKSVENRSSRPCVDLDVYIYGVNRVQPFQVQVVNDFDQLFCVRSGMCSSSQTFIQAMCIETQAL